LLFEQDQTPVLEEGIKYLKENYILNNENMDKLINTAEKAVYEYVNKK